MGRVSTARRLRCINVVLQFVEVSKTYPEAGEALSGVSFHIPRGQMAFLTGHSGAGKSTVLRLAALLERPSAGQVLVDGQNLARLSGGRVSQLRRKLGLIFQDPHLLRDRSVHDNVALPLLAAGYAARDVGRRVRAALDKVGLLHREKRFPQSLSAGEQQRVGIARAIVNKPPLILADEPTGNLDPQLAREIIALFVELNQVGVTLLVASHDVALIEASGKPALQLVQGRLIRE